MLDPRAVANYILDLAAREQLSITNLSLNKVVYFVHALYMSRTGRPLVDAKIEAWQYGPVFREVYHEFKSCGDKSINKRAMCFNVASGRYEEAALPVDFSNATQIDDLALPYIRMRPFDLVELSHEHGGPWHSAWAHLGDINPGMEITNEAIVDHFRQQVRH